MTLRGKNERGSFRKLERLPAVYFLLTILENEFHIKMNITEVLESNSMQDCYKKTNKQTRIRNK